MHVEWYGQSSFRLTDGSTTVSVDPFGDMTPRCDRLDLGRWLTSRDRAGDAPLAPAAGLSGG